MLLSEAMRPSNATAQWHERLQRPDIAGKIADGMKQLAVIAAPNPEMEALAIAVALREARHLGQIGGAGDAGPRAGAAGDGSARRAGTSITRIPAATRWSRRRPAFFHASPPKRPRAGWSRRRCWRCSSIRCAGLALRKAHRSPRSKRWSSRCCAGRARSPARPASRRILARFRIELDKLNRGEVSSLHRAEPRARLKDRELDRAQALIAVACRRR